MEIEEWINMTAGAKRAMLSYVANHDSMIEKITLNPPVEEKFAFLMTDPKIKQEVSSYFMSRIVDVHKFLKSYPFRKDQETQPLIFQVTDSFVHRNDGTSTP
jgi:predicted acetyltransferase